MRSCSIPITTAQNGSFQPIGRVKGVSRITRSTTARTLFRYAATSATVGQS